MIESICSMVIDEAGEYKPTNYLGKKVTKTDHNTIIVKMKMETLGRSKPSPFRNYKNEKSCEEFGNMIESFPLPYKGIKDVEMIYQTFEKCWSKVVNKSFRLIIPKHQTKPGISKSVRELLKMEKWIKKNVLQIPERGREIAVVRRKIKQEIQQNSANESIEK